MQRSAIHTHLHSKSTSKRGVISVLVVVSLTLMLPPITLGTRAAGSAANIAKPKPRAGTASLSSILNADGTLNRKTGVTGSFDVSRYRMELTARGAPRFVPLAGPGCGTPDWDPQFGLPNGTNGPVSALAVLGNAIYVGGSFTAAGNAVANYVAKFDTSTNTWSALSQGNGNGVNKDVNALAVSGNNLFVGGFFTTANVGGTGATSQITANRVAKFDTMANTWSALSQGNGNGVNNTVRALAASGNSLFVGGQFTTANLGGTGSTLAITANRVAKFDTMANTWSALSQGNGNGVNNAVFALALSGANLFVGGGLFTMANAGGSGATPAIPANNVAKFDTMANTWSALSQGNGNGVNSTVLALAVSGNNLFVGGGFTIVNVGGSGATPPITANRVAKFDTMANTWSALSQGDGNGVDSTVSALAVSGNNLFAGGFFSTVNVGGTGATPAIGANQVASFDTSADTWSVLSQGNGNGVDSTVDALAVSGNNLFVGGFLTTANVGGTGATPAIAASLVAKFDTMANTWSALSQSGANGVNGQINALAVSGNNLFVGGGFSLVGNVPVNNVAKFDTTTNTWSALSQGNGNGVDSSVAALALSGNSLFVVGYFTTANVGGTGATPAITANRVAKFDTMANTWSPLSQGNGNGVSSTVFVNSPVLALVVSGNSLFLGGQFTRVNAGGTGATPEITANYVAKFDTLTNTWSTLLQGNGNGMNFSVFALAVIGNNLFVGGSFTAANSGGTGATPAIATNRVAKFDTMANTWSALSQGNGNGVSDTVNALAVIGNNLFVGGFFTAANSGGTGATPAIAASRVAKFDTMANTWSALKQGNGNGLDNIVNALAVSGNNLFVGGFFTTANLGGTGGTPAIAANSVAKFDTSANTWGALAGSGGGNGASGSFGSGNVLTLAVKDCDLFVGGSFSFTDNKVSSDIARYGGQTPTAADGTISGEVTDTNGAPVAGVTLRLSGTESREAITDSSGTYNFFEVETNGFYTVTPSRANYIFSPANRSFSLLGVHTEASFTATANSDHENAIDTAEFFVRQQYLDFLGREPDPGGFAAWVGIINGCAPNDTSCDRVHVSQNFFQSSEFQGRGYFIYRFYPVSFPNVSGSDPPGYGHKPDYMQFVPDLARVSGFLTDAQLEAAKVAFIADFMSRPAFANTYNPLTNTQYVDMLLSNANAGISASARQGWIDSLNNSTLTRAVVLRQIAGSPEVYNKYYNPAFAIMEYFGYLRRDPDSAYLVWIQVLNQTNDPRGMITGFVNSQEYRARFGPS